MTRPQPRTPLWFVAAILTAGVLAFAGAFANAAAAQSGHRPLVRHAHRHHRRCGVRHRRNGRRNCAKTSRQKHRPMQRRIVRASTAVPVPGGPCPDAELVPSAGNLERVRAATLCLVNKVRLQHGEPPLRDSAVLDVVAQQHSASMVAGDYFSHASPSGEAFDVRIMAAGYVSPARSYELGENIECATLTLATPAAMVAGWMSSPEHRANILDGSFKDSGIGVAPAVPATYADGQPGATYTQDFGVVFS
jgi:uncharacterized protein YkwD